MDDPTTIVPFENWNNTILLVRLDTVSIRVAKLEEFLLSLTREDLRPANQFISSTLTRERTRDYLFRIYSNVQGIFSDLLFCRFVVVIVLFFENRLIVDFRFRDAAVHRLESPVWRSLFLVRSSSSSSFSMETAMDTKRCSLDVSRVSFHFKWHARTFVDEGTRKKKQKKKKKEAAERSVRSFVRDDLTMNETFAMYEAFLEKIVAGVLLFDIVEHRSTVNEASQRSSKKQQFDHRQIFRSLQLPLGEQLIIGAEILAIFHEIIFRFTQRRTSDAYIRPKGIVRDEQEEEEDCLLRLLACRLERREKWDEESDWRDSTYTRCGKNGSEE